MTTSLATAAATQPAPPPGGTDGSGPATPARIRPVAPLAVAVLLAVVGGVVLDTAFPGIGFWPAALVAPGMLLVAVHGRGPRAGYGLALLFGLGFMVPHLQWSGTYVGAMPWLALATSQALILGLVGLLWPACWRLASRPGLAWTLPLTAAAVWVAVEALRSRAPFGGFSWARAGFSQADSPLAWAAALAGIPLVSAAVVAVSAAVALVAVAALRRHGPAPARRLPAVTVLAATAAVVALIAGAGFLANSAARDGDRTISVAAVQGNVPTAGLDFNAERRAVTDNHAQATRALAADIAAGREPAVDLVLWPENSSDIDPLRNDDAARVISGATDAVGVPVLVGAVLREPADGSTNAMLVWEPGTGYRGDAEGRYAKQDVVPFAEYVPYRDFFRRITPLIDEAGRFVPGPGPGVLDVSGAVVGPVICFEVSRDGLTAEQVRLGAELLAVPTNNATFGFTDESTQQLVMSKLRAIEHGRAVVHASTVGVSAIFQPDGSSTRLTELFTQDVLVAEVPLHTGLTPSARLGEWPELIVTGAVSLAALGLVGAGLLRRRRAGTEG